MNMGIVDKLKNLGTKHERTDVVHDDSVNSGSVGSRERSTNEMMDEYYEKHPTHYMKLKRGINEKIKETKYKAADNRKFRKETREMERYAFREGKRVGRVKRANTRGLERGFGIPRQQPQQIRQVVIHEHGRRGKRQTRVNYAPQTPMQFDMMTGRYVPQQTHQHKGHNNGDMVLDMMTGRLVRRRR